MAVSGYQIRKHDRNDLRPSVVTYKKVDFLRLEPGSKFKPAIGDDIQMVRMDPDELKAIGDPMEEDCLVWARWGGASCEINQSRAFVVQLVNLSAEPNRSASTTREAVKYEDFRQMIDCISA